MNLTEVSLPAVRVVGVPVVGFDWSRILTCHIMKGRKKQIEVRFHCFSANDPRLGRVSPGSKGASVCSTPFFFFPFSAAATRDRPGYTSRPNASSFWKDWWWLLFACSLFSFIVFGGKPHFLVVDGCLPTYVLSLSTGLNHITQPSPSPWNILGGELHLDKNGFSLALGIERSTTLANIDLKRKVSSILCTLFPHWCINSRPAIHR
ncbi:hypothetical protein B0T19DRAFT_86266 [Cercophora scortea]|uniref:Uncharacterized protein n=1 Tax=Cercophora scortea TaxID=314031 RepID=A0AAE0IVL3_9PEZI|nr:hypothetical protein B0T19DRAFT_86266 [Cercophora scortea]